MNTKYLYLGGTMQVFEYTMNIYTQQNSYVIKDGLHLSIFCNHSCTKYKRFQWRTLLYTNVSSI